MIYNLFLILSELFLYNSKHTKKNISKNDLKTICCLVNLSCFNSKIHGCHRHYRQVIKRSYLI